MRIAVELPEDLARVPRERQEERARFLLVVDAVREGRLTRGAGARSLGMTLDDFLIAAGPLGLYAIDCDPADFQREPDDIAARGV